MLFYFKTTRANIIIILLFIVIKITRGWHVDGFLAKGLKILISFFFRHHTTERRGKKKKKKHVKKSHIVFNSIRVSSASNAQSFIQHLT